MTQLTPTLSLVLYDNAGDLTATFNALRTAWGGVGGTSNFSLIDDAVGDLDTRVTDLESELGTPFVLGTTQTTNNFTGSITGLTGYVNGLTIVLSLDNTTTGAATLNLNSLGAVNLMKVDPSTTLDIALESGDLKKNMCYMFVYDVDRWIWVNATTANQINITGTAGDIVKVSSSNTLQSQGFGAFVNALTEKVTPVIGDLIGIADSAASFASKKLSIGNLLAILGTYINSLTGKTTPVGADEIIIGDSAASYANKKVLLSNLYKSLGTGTPTGQTALLGDGSWGAVGGSFWNLMLGTPVRTGNTTFTVTGDYTSLLKKGMIIKWTESSVVRVGMIAIPSTYGAPDTTVTIIGDTMASIDASSLKYALADATKILFAVAGTIGATGTDVSMSYYAEYPYRVIGADIYTGTAGTTNNTTADVNKNGTSMFTTKPTLATTVAASPTPFTADSGTSLALNDKVTIDVDAIQTTAAVDLYVKLYLFPERMLHLG